MTSIQTLIPDIQKLVGENDGWFSKALADSFASEVSARLVEQYGEQGTNREGPDAANDNVPSPTQSKKRRGLRLSQMGPKCPRALWASVHAPDEAEALPAWAQVKFSFGHIIEALAVSLAKAAGHEVTGEQDELVADGVVGHRDCVIDGCIVDVKSAASLSFAKFKDGSIASSDTFGYLDQLDGYLYASLEDPLVRVKDRAYLFAIDKQLGHMCLYEHKFREDHIRKRIASYKAICGLPTPPECTCQSIEDGASGNLKLDVRASYNPYKYFCKPYLRTFLYSGGPRYLTKVVRTPDVPEINRHGTIIIN